MTPLHFDYTEIIPQCQATPPNQAERLVDDDGRIDWRGKKMANETLALAFSAFDKSKAERLASCSTFLQFKVYANGERKLSSMNSCHVRLCPLCSWRRSLKVYSNIRRVADYLTEKEGRRYILVTLTVPNCTGDKLGEVLDHMYKAFNRFNQLKAIKSAFTGFYRALEVTRNCNLGSPLYGTYHPHFHCLFSVKKSYFNSRYYLSQELLVKLWERSMRRSAVNHLWFRVPDPVIPWQVDVRRVRGDLGKSCAEVAKYSVKSSDVIVPEDLALTSDVARILDRALERRRLISYGGELSDVRRVLALDDEESGDLVHIENEVPTEEDYSVVNYFWFSGFRDYFAF
jgi:plasmid rolling circle replication initiator protein Rep